MVYESQPTSQVNNVSESQSFFDYEGINKLNIGFSGVGYEGYDVVSLAYSYSGPISEYSSNSALEYDAVVGLNYGLFDSDYFSSDFLLTSLGLGVGYCYFYSESFRVSAGLGYAYSYGSIYYDYDDSSYDSLGSELDISSGGFYYYSNLDYFLSDTFGVNMRYDYVSGISFGVQWKSN